MTRSWEIGVIRITMNDDSKLEFSRATKLHEAGDYERARGMLEKLVQSEPGSVTVLAVLGHVLYDLREFREAARVFRQAAEMAPKLEAVSLGLFHSLWELNRQEEAMEELGRFQSVSDSQDYREIVKEINKG